MNILKGIVNDLRQRRLWPIALVLVLALVAVPVLLSKKASSTPVAQLPATGAPTSLSTSGPAVTVEGTPDQTHLKGKGRDPFTPQGSTATPSTASGSTASTASTGSTGSAGSAAGSTAGASTGATGSTGSTGSTGTGGSGGGSTVTPLPPTSPGGTTPVTTPPVTGVPTGKPQPAPAGLQADQTYRVTLSVTNSKGGLNRIDPVERLSVLPSKSDPLLVELGVLKGGDRVLFAVQPGTVVHGPGKCTPGAIDCEVLSLGTNQVESVSVQTPTGVTPVAQFAVTAIGTDNHGSRSAAGKARRQASDAGRRLLSKSTLKALSLFEYDPSIGAVLDLRNLTVGGN
jgi:hypothetical protein